MGLCLVHGFTLFLLRAWTWMVPTEDIRYRLCCCIQLTTMIHSLSSWSPSSDAKKHQMLQYNISSLCYFCSPMTGNASHFFCWWSNLLHKTAVETLKLMDRGFCMLEKYPQCYRDPSVRSNLALLYNSLRYDKQARALTVLPEEWHKLLSLRDVIELTIIRIMHTLQNYTTIGHVFYLILSLIWLCTIVKCFCFAIEHQTELCLPV